MGCRDSPPLLAFAGANDADILPAFVRHYRTLGASPIVLALQGNWPAPSLQWLALQNDVEVVARVAQPFSEALKLRHLNSMAQRWTGRWVLAADPDEFLELPATTIATTIEALEHCGSQVLPAFIVQRLAPDGRLPSLPADADPAEQYTHWDYHLAERMGCSPPVWKTVYPLSFVTPGFQFYRGNHFPPGGPSTAHLPLRGIVNHYKWRAALHRSLKIPRGKNANDHEQRHYRRWLLAHDDRLPTAGARIYSRASMVSCGLLVEAPTATAPRSELVTELDQAPGRIALVSSQIAGPTKCGGVATAVSSLAERLTAAGHRVELIYAPFNGPTELWEGWYEYWAGRDVRLHYLPRARVGGRGQRSYRAFRTAVAEYLVGLRCELLYFNDGDGFGAEAGALRAAGLGFADARFVTTVHGPNVWHRRGNRLAWNLSEALHGSGFAQSMQLTDVLCFPSHYMQQWLRAYLGGVERQHSDCDDSDSTPLPDDGACDRPVTAIIPNCPAGLTRSFNAPQRRRAVNEIVFYGRLEPSKGLDVFAGSLHQLQANPATLTVTFLGKYGAELNRGAIAALLPPTLQRVNFHTNYDSVEAINYLKVNDCLAVMPSISDNVPYTVYECLEAAIPCIAARTGGIPELVHPDDHHAMLCASDAHSLAQALDRILAQGTAPSARLAFDPTAVEQQHLELAARLLADTRHPTTKAQSVTDAACVRQRQVVRYGDAPAWSGEANRLNTALARGAPTDHLLLLHTSVGIDESGQLQLQRLLAMSGFDAAVTDFRIHPSAATLQATASAAELAASSNLFGAPAFVITRAAFVRCGGFSPGQRQSLFAHWELLNRLLAGGGRIASLPAPAVLWRLTHPQQLAHRHNGQLQELLILPWLAGLPASRQLLLRKAAADFGNCPELQLAAEQLRSCTWHGRLVVGAQRLLRQLGRRLVLHAGG